MFVFNYYSPPVRECTRLSVQNRLTGMCVCLIIVRRLHLLDFI
jgi:hypothetical protein